MRCCLLGNCGSAGMRSTAHNGHSKLGRSMTAPGTNRSTSDKNKCVIKSASFADKTQMGIKRNGGSKGLDKFGLSYGQQVFCYNHSISSEQRPKCSTYQYDFMHVSQRTCFKLSLC
jgi:hypothetical protein